RHRFKRTPCSLPRAPMKSRPLLLLALACWLSAVGAGAAWLLDYRDDPGRPAGAPADWPAGSALERRPGAFTLLFFAHPRCPCTRASLEELAWLLTRSRGKVDARVLFVLPPGAPPGWERSHLWRRASAIPGLAVACDPSGREARRFGVETS